MYYVFIPYNLLCNEIFLTIVTLYSISVVTFKSVVLIQPLCRFVILIISLSKAMKLVILVKSDFSVTIHVYSATEAVEFIIFKLSFLHSTIFILKRNNGLFFITLCIIYWKQADSLTNTSKMTIFIKLSIPNEDHFPVIFRGNISSKWGQEIRMSSL